MQNELIKGSHAGRKTGTVLSESAHRAAIDAILYSCITPAFVWRIDTGEIVQLNELGTDMLKRMNPESDSVFIGDYVQNWTSVRTVQFQVMWFEFVQSTGRIFNVQVRNTLLGEREEWVVTVVVNVKWAGDQTQGRTFDGLTGLIRTASNTFLSRTDFRENFGAFLNRTTIALNLSSFNFIPSERLRPFGLYEQTEQYARSSPEYGVFAPYLRDFQRLESGKLFELSELDAKIPGSYLIYPVTDGQKPLGWFTLVLYENRAYMPDNLQTILEVFVTFFQTLIDKIEMTKSLYQSDFENRLNRRVVENVSEGIVIVNESFRIVYINKIATKMFGFTPDDVYGHPLDDLLVSNASIQAVVDKIHGESDSFDEIPAVQYFHHRSGDRFPCRIRFSKLAFDDRYGYYIFVLTDVTETEESRRKTEQLTQRALLGDFASMTAHEIRNPVNNINTWIQNIKADCEPDGSIYAAAETIEKDCQRVSNIIGNILTFSRALTLNLELTDFVAFIEMILDRWKRDFANENITCIFNRPERFPFIKIDTKSMDQVLTNLIQNAVEAINHTGGTISLKLSEKDSATGRKEALLSISNSGPGIPDEIMEHLFEPFFTSKKTGNGWGLALSKRIVTSHRGTIQVKSLSEGVVFEIYLPIPAGGMA